MTNPEHLAILKQGVEAWNRWREENPEVQPDLVRANIRGMDLTKVLLGGANLSQAILVGAILRGADLQTANLHKADLTETDLRWAHLGNARLRGALLNGSDLTETDLQKAILSRAKLQGAIACRAFLARADLFEADLRSSDLSEADLSEANLASARLQGAKLHQAILRGAALVRADLTDANLTRACLENCNLVEAMLARATLSGCRIYGASVWRVHLEHTIQKDLTITPEDKATITVDNLEMAQFIYLLLNNEKIREVIDTVGRKAVLILGRFGDHKVALDGIRDALRQHDYLPILFDFEKPVSQDFTSTVETLARLSRFIIADLSAPRCIPHELASVIPHLRTVPVQPILLTSQEEYAMFGDYRAYPWVLATHKYTDLTDLLRFFVKKVIAPAEAKAKELTGR